MVPRLLFECRFLKFFGVSEDVCFVMWEQLEINPDVHEEDKGCEPCYLLCALLFLKMYDTEGKHCKVVGENVNLVDQQTFQKWSWLFVGKNIQHFS